MATQPTRESPSKVGLKDLANWLVPPILTWILAAGSGAYAIVSTRQSSEPFPLTVIAFLVTSAAVGAACWFFARFYIWDPVHRFETLPDPIAGRPQRKALVTELEEFEKEVRARILKLVPLATEDEEEWFKRTEILFSAYTTSRSLRKGLPAMKQAARKARAAIALSGFATFLVSLFLLYLPQDPSWGFGAVMTVVAAGFLGIALGFFNADDKPRRADWGQDVTTLCDATSESEMRGMIQDWAEAETRQRRIGSR
jgi:hypothetical protein